MSSGEEEAATEQRGSVDLFSPHKLGRWQLKHRMVMPSCTRCRAVNNTPNAAMAHYYSQRATPGGLIITEGTIVSPVGAGYPHTPGIFSEEQVEAWKLVVDAVRAKGAAFFCQLWHTGRVSHAVYQPNGGSPVSSTNEVISDRWKILMPDGSYANHSRPRALATEEIPEIIDQFRQGALNAIRAGFDGVTLHGAFGYIIDQFIKDGINDRTDEYGGSLENRLKFLERVVDAAVAAVGVDRVALKISPTVYIADAHDSDPLGLALAIAERLNGVQEATGLKFAYLHYMAGSLKSGMSEEEVDILRQLRKAYKGTMLTSGGFDKVKAMKFVAEGLVDLVAFGRNFVANPDLVERFKVDAPLNAADPSVFYTQEPVIGYTDFPYLDGHTEPFEG
ncbi:hypothetical protein Ancab_010017 [Ancistrocladus abbreviatus]